ncbi:MAG: MFS transporter [Pseudomonadales bacterium]|nr:MFS transporter [Pseudomonadales bacterium]MCP5358954.1 MFS transporter [Pseudomonadales bacterium]
MTDAAERPAGDAPPHRSVWLRGTLGLSQKEAVASATMTATGDNFFNAFAIYLNASAVQMGWLMAIPQLFGALCQVLSAWLGNYLPRKPLVVMTARMQTLVVAGLSLLALTRAENSVAWLIGLAVLYFSCINFIQPQWRAWMGSVVPQRRRGTFFASRTRLTMMASLGIFLSGGALLSLSQRFEVVWLGFALLFAIAATGRGYSSHFLAQMHDPDPSPHPASRKGFWQSIVQLRASLSDKTFRDYSFFVAGMQGVVAISAPFFAVYMLRDLEFTYLEYSLNATASILTQFLMLRFWGRFSDRFGNRLVMQFSSVLIPLMPLMWLFSTDYVYLLGVQVLSGFVWSGFSLSTANYLYDIRPHRSDFAVYAAMQSALSACAVFMGAILGGLIASAAPKLVELLPFLQNIRSPLYLVFFSSFLLRALIAAWFVPRAVEPHMRRRPQLLQLIFRVSRFNAISGVSLDWLSVTRRDDGNTAVKDEDVTAP